MRAEKNFYQHWEHQQFILLANHYLELKKGGLKAFSLLWKYLNLFIYVNFLILKLSYLLLKLVLSHSNSHYLVRDEQCLFRHIK